MSGYRPVRDLDGQVRWFWFRSDDAGRLLDAGIADTRAEAERLAQPGVRSAGTTNPRIGAGPDAGVGTSAGTNPARRSA